MFCKLEESAPSSESLCESCRNELQHFFAATQRDSLPVQTTWSTTRATIRNNAIQSCCLCSKLLIWIQRQENSNFDVKQGNIIFGPSAGADGPAGAPDDSIREETRVLPELVIIDICLYSLYPYEDRKTFAPNERIGVRLTYSDETWNLGSLSASAKLGVCSKTQEIEKVAI